MDAQVRRTSTRRSKHLSRPERFQPAEPILRKKESTPWDSWVLFSLIVTFWAPSPLLSSVGGLRDKASQQAWREKIALFSIAIILSGIVCFMTVGFTAVMCPAIKLRNEEYLRYGENPGNYPFRSYSFFTIMGKVVYGSCSVKEIYGQPPILTPCPVIDCLLILIIHLVS